MKQFGTTVPATAAARTKQRIAGGVIAVAVSIDLVASLIGANGGRREIVGALLFVGGALLLGCIVYMYANRRAS
jgi:hypothetical protein